MGNSKKLTLAGTLLLSMPLLYGPFIYAAKAVDLSRQNIAFMQSLVSSSALSSHPQITVKEISRATDFNKTLHIRVQEMYSGYPVWGGDAVVHLPQAPKSGTFGYVLDAGKNQATMNGIFYENLHDDLGNAPATLFEGAQSQKAVNYVLQSYEHKVGENIKASDQESKLIVFIDKNNKAHWAYKISFTVPGKKGRIPAKPVYIIDANTFAIYKEWDNIQTKKPKARGVQFGGGFGGNIKMGKMSYDGLPNDLPRLRVTRYVKTKTCALQNDSVTVKHFSDGKVSSYACVAPDSEHNNIYWDQDLHAVNDGYSPDNDALFGGAVIKNMYEKWYGIPVLIEDGKPMMLNMIVHDPIDNAYWDGKQMTFGDGVDMFYPLTSLGVAAHEISHGFTQQHSNLNYYGQSGGMNEAYSDMAAQAAEYYAYKKNSWQIGPEIFKEKDEALRYMDQPSKDCHGRTPGSQCSIDEVSQYHAGLDVHYSSGIYNRVFYLIGTAKGWNTRKAFDIMVHANSHYWTSNVSWEEGACGVLSAAKSLNYKLDAVYKAFKVVGIETANCKI